VSLLLRVGLAPGASSASESDAASSDAEHPTLDAPRRRAEHVRATRTEARIPT
jgi:hypothetical protein